MITNARSQEKRSKILEIASELFLERGYESVSLDDIIERSGGSKTTLYSYYGGKEGLFAAIVESNCKEKLGPILSLDFADRDPRASLTAFGRRLVSLVGDPAGRALYRLVIAEADRFPKIAARFYATGPEAIIRLIRGNIEHWQSQRLMRPGDAETMATQFIGILLGNFSTRSLLGLAVTPTTRQLNEWVNCGVRLFLEGMLPK